VITVLFYVTVKKEREHDFLEVADRLTKSTHAEDTGCVAYTFYRQVDRPLDVVLYEQWSDQEALNSHISRLQKVLGPPDDEEPFPPTHHRRRLPKSFLALFEKTDAIRYEPVV